MQNTNPYEELSIDNSFIERISVDEMRGLAPTLDHQMARLSGLADVIYIHVDLSILSAEEVPDLPASSFEGISSHDLAAVLEKLFSYPKATAIGIAGLPNGAGEISVNAAYALIEGAIGGVRSR